MSNTQWYRYAPGNFFVREAVVVWVALVILLFGGGLTLMRLTIPALAWPLAVMSFPILAFLAAPVIAIAFATADISTDAEGITLHVMGLYKRHIAWSELRHTTLWEVAPPRYADILALHHWDEIHAVYVPGLKGFNVTGILFGLGSMSAIIITPDHANHKQLIRRLKHMQHPMGRKKEGRLRR